MRSFPQPSIAPTVGLAFALAIALAAPAQDLSPAVTDEPLDKAFEIPFWHSDRSFQLRAALALLGAGTPLGVVSARVAISENVPAIPGWTFDFDTLLPINRRYLDMIQDGRPLPKLDRKELKELPAPDRGFYLALTDALRRSAHATTEMFDKGAEENNHVVFSHLRASPQQQRGKVVTVKGKLALIRRENPPRYLGDDSITDIYTGWIVGPNKGMPPFTVVFTQLPPELQVSEKLDVPVTFRGYFLAHIRFPADKDLAGKQQDVVSPYLVGKTVIVQREPAGPSVSYSYPIIVTVVCGFVSIAVLGAVLVFFFRRSDQKIRSKIADTRERHNPFTLE